MLLARCVDSRSDFLETTGEEMARTLFYMFWFRFIPEMFSALSAAFLCGRAFVRFSARLAVRYFVSVYLVLIKEFNQANFNGNGSEYDGSVSVRYNSLFIFLLLFTKIHKQQRELTTFCIFERT